jgi:hypothetical protein
VTKHTQCPKCGAELPRKGQFCLECGLDLYAEGIHRPPGPWVPLLLLVLAAGGVVAFLATRPREQMPPEERLVRDHTAELLRLAHEGNYTEMVQRFFEPDRPRYERTGELLRNAVRGDGAPGLNVFRATCMDNLEEAAKFVRRHKAEHPELLVRMLAAITFKEGALRTSLGGTAFGTQRTELFLAWFLELAFGEADTANAQVTDVAWRDGPDGEPLLVATVRYPQPAAPLPGVPDPTVIPWRRLGEGKWVVLFDAEAPLRELLALLRRVKL